MSIEKSNTNYLFLSRNSLKTGDLVLVRGETSTGIVLSVSSSVPYEGSYANVLLDKAVRSINTNLLAKIYKVG
jgi:hypothetical protein